MAAHWQVNVGNSWTDMGENEQAQLSKWDGAEDPFQLESKGQTYTVTASGPDAWTLHNVKSGKTRPLRRWRPAAVARTRPQAAGRVPITSLATKSAPAARAEGRAFVWRDGDWHPVSTKEDNQIKAALCNGYNVFEVAVGAKRYRVDTTGKKGWMRSSLDGSTQTPMMFKESRGGEQDGDGVASTGNPQSKLLEELRHEWVALYCHGSSPSRASPRSGGGEEVSEEEVTHGLKRAFTKLAEGQNRVDEELLTQEVADLFLNVDLGRDQSICECEWIHFRLLHEQAPSFFAVCQVNELVLAQLAKEKDFLRNMVDLFQESCRESADARLTPLQMRNAAQAWRKRGHAGLRVDSECAYLKMAEKSHHERGFEHEIDVIADLEVQREERVCTTSSARASCSGDWMGGLQACIFRDREGTNETSRLSRETDIKTTPTSSGDHHEDLTYYDFANVLLSNKMADVQLYRYDISEGTGAWIAPLLLGKGFQGIWHTGIVVHGKEYWFGGNVFESPPGTTPFGTPKEIQTIGATMCTSEGLWNFIQRELIEEFTPENYDVLTHNCNHFSNACCMYLLNHHIPDDVLKQPELVMNSWAAQLLRPMLNEALGRFEADGKPSVAHDQEKYNDKKQAEDDWTSITEGSLVVYEYEPGWTSVARVTQKQASSQTCNVQWVDLVVGRLRSRAGVSKMHVHPLKQAQSLSQRGAYGSFNAWYHAPGANNSRGVGEPPTSGGQPTGLDKPAEWNLQH